MAMVTMITLSFTVIRTSIMCVLVVACLVVGRICVITGVSVDAVSVADIGIVGATVIVVAIAIVSSFVFRIVRVLLCCCYSYYVW